MATASPLGTPEKQEKNVVSLKPGSGRRALRLLVNSHAYVPSIGGSESACELLVEGLLNCGFELRVVTKTPAPVSEEEEQWPVVRNPSSAELLRLVWWADIVVHSNISLQVAWPLLIHPRPWVIIHHSALSRHLGSRSWNT